MCIKHIMVYLVFNYWDKQQFTDIIYSQVAVIPNPHKYQRSPVSAVKDTDYFGFEKGAQLISFINVLLGLRDIRKTSTATLFSKAIM